MPDSIEELRTRLDSIGLTVQVFAEVGVGAHLGQMHEQEIEDFRLRIALYFYLVKDVCWFLAEEIPRRLKGEGLSSELVRPALEDVRLLARYCMVIDEFVIPALSFDLGGDREERKRNLIGPYGNTLESYFKDYILNAEYDKNLLRFYGRYPTTSHAVYVLTENFKGNILSACERILKDWNVIGRVFKVKLGRLMEIRSTGSDFHKGGKQVLALQFETTAPGATRWRLIYKPSDIEADCLLVGEAEAVNRRYDHGGTFMEESLLEIINGCISEPSASLQKLPTYKILPMNVGSDGFPVREAYGYIEFLERIDEPRLSVFGWYPFGSTNFRFYNRENPETVSKFYVAAGELMAIASTFSMQDLHLENVFAINFLPRLIDLEVCLTNCIKDVQDTSLLSNNEPFLSSGWEAEQFINRGGFNGTGSEAAFWQLCSNQGQQGKLFYRREYAWPIAERNRLYGPNAVVPVESEALLAGLFNMLELLGKHVDKFDAWFERIDGIVVRYVPATTGDFYTMRKEIYFDRPSHPFEQNLADIASRWYELMAQRYERPSPPNFEAFNPKYTTPDMRNCDIPIYYRKIDEVDIMDSRGRRVSIAQRTLDVPSMSQANPRVIDVGRTTFFSVPPTHFIVHEAQLRPLSDFDFFLRRFSLLTRSAEQSLGDAQSADQCAPEPH